MLNIRFDIIILIAYSILLWVSSGQEEQQKKPRLNTSSYLLDESKPILREKKRQRQKERDRESEHVHFLPGYKF